MFGHRESRNELLPTQASGSSLCCFTYSSWLPGTGLVDNLGVAFHNLSYWKWNIRKSNYWWEQGIQPKSLLYLSAPDYFGLWFTLFFFSETLLSHLELYLINQQGEGVSAQKRELLSWEAKTSKIHPALKTKSMTNQSDTYIKLKAWAELLNAVFTTSTES